MASDITVPLTDAEVARIDASDPVRRDHSLTARLQDAVARVTATEADVTAIEAVAETPFDAGLIPIAALDLDTNPTAGNTITIGADVYEFKSSGNVAADTNIAVLRGADAAASLVNLLAAINAEDANNAHATLFKTDGTTPALANGTENVLATAPATSLFIQPADEPGGTLVPSSPSIALSDTLAAAVAWSVTNLNTAGGRTEGQRSCVRVSFAITAAMITYGGTIFSVPFTPAGFTWSARTATGATRVSGADTLAVVAGSIFMLTLGNDTADLDATDIVTAIIWS